jgi:hypothetical protein
MFHGARNAHHATHTTRAHISNVWLTTINNNHNNNNGQLFRKWSELVQLVRGGGSSATDQVIATQREHERLLPYAA